MQLLINQVKSVSTISSNYSIDVYTKLDNNRFSALKTYTKFSDGDRLCIDCTAVIHAENKDREWLFFRDNDGLEYMGTFDNHTQLIVNGYEYICSEWDNDELDIVEIEYKNPKDTKEEMLQCENNTFIYIRAVDTDICPRCLFGLTGEDVFGPTISMNDMNSIINSLYDDDCDIIIDMEDGSYYTMNHSNSGCVVAHYLPK